MSVLSQGAQAQSSAWEPTGTVTLEDAVGAALAGSPDLAGYSDLLRGAQARQKTAKQWVNPILGLELEDALGTGGYHGLAQSQTTLQVGQLFEFGNKREARALLAQGVADQVSRDFEIKRAAVLTDVAIKFTHVLADQHRLALAEQAYQIAQAGLKLANKRVGLGAASALEVSRARIWLARCHINEEHAQHELLSSRQRLAATWGATQAKFAQLQANLFTRPALPTLAQLESRVEANPELLKLYSALALRDAEVSLAKSHAVPDLRLALGARYLARTNDFTAVAGAALALPVFNQNEGDIGHAHARRDKLHSEQQAVWVQTLTALHGLFQEVTHAVTELETLEKETLPLAKDMLATLEDGFETGRFSQLEVIDAQQLVLEERRRYIQAAEEYHMYIAQIEQLLGGSISEASAKQAVPQ